MSLQGSIDTFEVPDILRLLASTKKTGQLAITGNRGNGNVWVKNGDITSSEASAAPWASTNAEVIFELLRYTTGDFIFYANEDVPMPEEGKNIERVDPALNTANGMLKEWEEIEKVVPSLASPLRLAVKLPEPIVEINEASWKMIVGIGSGTTVGNLGNTLEQSEIVVSRNVKQLIEAKLVEIEHAEPVLPSGDPMFQQDMITPKVSYSTPDSTEVAPEETEETEEVVAVVASPYVDTVYSELDTADSSEEETEMEDSLEEVEEEIVEGISGEAVVEHQNDAAAGVDGESFTYTGGDSTSPFDYGTGPAEQTSEDVDLDDPVQVARAIEQMDQEVTRSVTLAARSVTAEERDTILADLQQKVSALDFAVIQRFVYSLTT